MDELIAQKIQSVADAILFYLNHGRSEDEAIATMRRASTLGPKSWEAVLARVKATQDETRE